MENTQNKLELFKSLFKGREDVFAIRWEKGNKSGYMPAYSFDPYRFRMHKAKGGTLQNYPDKSFLPFTNEQIVKHLNGEQFIGLYPLLTDNTSWFIVADFDESNWIISSKKFIEACEEVSIPAYLERSRSGNGGHVWVFFDKPFPAYKSRMVMMTLLTSSGIVSVFDKNTSFDRLFPNQDYLSGKGLGNLIALPLHLTSGQKENSCFIDPGTQTPYADQWQFLQNIQRVSIDHLEKIYSNLINSKQYAPIDNSELIITLNNTVQLNKNAINQTLSSFLKEELNFLNTEYIIKKNSGRITFGTNRYFRFISEEGNKIILPKGFIGKLIRFCRDNGIPHKFIDERKLHTPVPFSFQATLRNYQQECLTTINKKDIGVIVAPPGSGKTVIALKVVAEKCQPALIIVHRKQLADQWIERIEAFLKIPQKAIGRIGQGKTKIGKHITVATIQSLVKTDFNTLKDAFGLIIVDECHHIPAETFLNTISKLYSYYLYGLTATPFRKYNDGKLIFIHLGDIISEVRFNELDTVRHPEIIIRNTQLEVPFNGKTDRFETLSKILVHDSGRNKLILQDVVKELNQSRKVVILTERKEHIDTLYQYLKQSFETITLTGEDIETSRRVKLEVLNSGNYQVLITTGQFFGEGSDLQNASCLFLAYPFSFEGKLIQYIGRVQRSEISPTIYDYRDIKIDYLNRMFLKRNVYYRKFEKQVTLFDIPVEDTLEAKSVSEVEKIIEKNIKVKIEELDFLYGSFQFRCQIHEHSEELIFDIENLNIRPEFEVLKPFFEKFLKSKTVDISVVVVLDKNKVVSAMTAQSTDLEKINREAVEGVRFKFVEKTFFGKKISAVHDGLNQPPASGDNGNNLYDSNEELLTDILSKGNYRHQKQLHYLAERHKGVVLKIRFVLSPFAFVFLLEGDKQYHLVLETLDTDEATYIWHLPLNLDDLKQGLSKIDIQLNTIRTQGRQAFLQTNPENFNRIFHEYSDLRKGFIEWRDALEEHLF
ncbi:DEAD/DEAH box helicase [Solitalea lacus]|uniref:DEAD/DEAH box helicase n=1 Tax=Solitalea lacus TaxID=2911172 RepID=UPI001EDB1CE4|nr:DEAD/DEAH box helicase [Solitalea lacus]UKJ06131.1 DEAD/DEAH box helicase [Solitalea lacus]